MSPTVYRERRRLSRPAATARRRLVAEHGDPDDDPGTSTQEWRWAVLGGLYRYRATLDAADGTLSVAVAVPAPVAWLAALSLPVAVGAALAGDALPAPATAVVLWGTALLAIVPAVHLAPGVPGGRPSTPGAETVARRLSGHAVPPFLGVLVLLWSAGDGPAAVASPVPVVPVVVGALLFVGLSALHVAGSLDWPGSGATVPADAGDDPAGVPTAGLALSALLAAALTAGNGLVALRAVALGSSGRLLALAVVLAVDAAYFAYCRLAAEAFAGARIRPPVARRSRALGTALVALGTVGLSLVGSLAAVSVLPEGGPVAAVVRAPDRAVLVAAALLPAGVVLLGWLVHVTRGVAGAVWARLISDPLDPGTLDAGTPPTGASGDDPGASVADPAAVVRSLEVPVRVADLRAPAARPVRTPLGGFVLVDRRLVEGLSGAELAAAVAHEAYHLRADPATGPWMGLAALVLGGRNAALALLDYPAVERAADRFAVERVDGASLAGALRGSQRLRLEAAGDLDAPAGDAPGSLRRATTALGATLTAPYRLLFGPLLLDRAHDDVETRVRRALSWDGTGGEDGSTRTRGSLGRGRGTEAR